MILSARPFMAAMACLFVVAVQAQTPAVGANEAPVSASMQLLQRIQSSAQELDYAGVFTYQQGASMQSSRVTHVTDAKGEHERLEVLDGQPLEFLRNNDEVRCLIPHKKAIVIETRLARDRFPGLLQQGKAEQLAQHYNISVEPKPERVADRDCQVINLQPKDNDRYGYRFCADTSSGLLLRSQTLAHAPGVADSVVVEQVAFITLHVGNEVDTKQLKTRWSTKDWKVVKMNLTPTDLAAHGWTVGEPAGFHQVMQVQRSIGGKADVKQVMLSDGLAAISVFIEPFSAGHPQQIGPTSRGAINVVGRRLGSYWITVLGEAPLATIQQVAQSIDYKPVSRNP